MNLEEEIKQTIFQNEYHKLILNILFTGSWLESSISKIIKEYDLSHAQYNILRILGGQHPAPANVSNVQERMLDRLSDASRLIEKLRCKGMVERKECPVNRRQMDVTITDKGLSLLEQIDVKMKEYHKQFQSIMPTEAIEVNRILDKMRESV